MSQPSSESTVYPNPPWYFEKIEELKPPPIPSDLNLEWDLIYQNIYNKNYSKLNLPSYLNFLDNIRELDVIEEPILPEKTLFGHYDVKKIQTLLKKKLQIIISYTRNIAALTPTSETHTELQKTIAEFNSLLALYRRHEAKEILYLSLEKEYQDGLALKDSLQKCYDELQGKYDQILALKEEPH